MDRAIWSPQAESELEDIVYYIRERDGRPETASRIAWEIERAVESYAARTYRGYIHPDAPEGWFYFRHKRWLVFYQPISDGIEVMRIIDGSRDMPQQFGD
jgi:toxin ParE1/3/4